MSISKQTTQEQGTSDKGVFTKKQIKHNLIPKTSVTIPFSVNSFVKQGLPVMAILCLIFAYVVFAKPYDYRDDLKALSAKAEEQRKEIEVFKSKWDAIEKGEIAPRLEQARDIELMIIDIKNRRRIEVESKVLRHKQELQCIKVRWEYVEKNKKPAPETLCQLVPVDQHIKDKDTKTGATIIKKKLALAEATAIAEGNGLHETNPCNIRDSKKGGFKQFKDREEGLVACKKVFEGYVKHNPNVTLLGAINTFSPASDNNDPKQHASNIIYFLARDHGIDATFGTKLKDLL